MATKAGRVDLAKQHFLKVTHINQKLLQSEPDSVLYKADLAYVTKRLASLAIAASDYSQAVQLANQSKDYYFAVSKAEPLDTEARRNVGSAWDTVFEAHMAAGELESASRAIEKACDLFIDLCDEFPETAKFPVLAVEALFKRAECKCDKGINWNRSSGCVVVLKPSNDVKKRSIPIQETLTQPCAHRSSSSKVLSMPTNSAQHPQPPRQFPAMQNTLGSF